MYKPSENSLNNTKTSMMIFVISLVLLPFLISLSYFTSYDKVQQSIEFAQKIVVVVNGNENNDLELIEIANGQTTILKGSKLNIKPINLKVVQANIPFVLRMKLNLDVVSSNPDTKQALQTGILNAMGLTNQNSWVELWGHYYYIGSGLNEFEMKTTNEGVGSGGSQNINGAMYNPVNSTRTKPNTENEILNMTLSSISGKTQTDLIPFSLGGQYIIPNELDINGEIVNLTVEIETIQDLLVSSQTNATVLPTVLNAFSPKPLYQIIVENDITYVLFGEYPQTIIASGVTVDESKGTDSRGYYLGSDGFYYAKVTAKPTCTAMREKKTYSNGTKIENGTTHYFKVEPIKWRILKEENGKAMLLSDIILEARAYQSTSHSDGTSQNNYEKSEVRNWLNTTFYNKAFNEAMKGIVLTTEVDNSASTTENDTNQYASDVKTNDKVYLLSYQDLINPDYGFNADTRNGDPNRQKQTSDYGIATGAPIREYNGNWNGGWWSRSPYPYHDSYVRLATGDGYVSDDYVISTFYGAAPALTIQIS